MALPYSDTSKEIHELWKVFLKLILRCSCLFSTCADLFILIAQHEGHDKSVEQHRLKCCSDAPGVLSSAPDSPCKDFPPNSSKQLSDLSIQVYCFFFIQHSTYIFPWHLNSLVFILCFWFVLQLNRLYHSQQEIQRNLRTTRMLQWLNSLLTLILAVAIWFTAIREPHQSEEVDENSNLFSVNADEL